MSTPLEVRKELVDALRLDLVGPIGPLGNPKETLTQTPSRWYLTGFLVPTDADAEQRCDPTSNDELDQAAEPAGLDDDSTPEKPAARRSYLPSSMGISVLLPAEANELDAVVRYGEYMRVEHDEDYTGPQHWRRIPREEVVPVKIDGQVPDSGVVAIPNSRGVELVWSIRRVPDGHVDGGLPDGTRSLSVFVVNRRKAARCCARRTCGSARPAARRTCGAVWPIWPTTGPRKCSANCWRPGCGTRPTGRPCRSRRWSWRR